jgi:cell wall-associated NlpC family hydrolase
MVQRFNAGRSRPLILLLAGIMIATALFPANAFADTDLDIGGVAVVAYANGDSVRLRSQPSTSGDVIDHVAEGTQVEVLDGPAGGSGTLWYLIRANGVKGYIAADFLAASSGLLSSTSGSAWAVDSVNVRSGPSTADSVVTTLGYGESVTLTGDASNGWLSVSASGGSGWVYGAFLSQENNSSSSSSSSSGSWAGVSGTYYTSDNLNLRASATTRSDTIDTLPRGSEVWLYGEEENGFALASTQSGDGWLNTSYLTSNQPASSASASSSGTGTRYTSDSLNLRTSATTRSDVIETLSRGAEVWLYGREENGFTFASTSAGDGWLNTAYLTSSRPSSSASQSVIPAATPTSDGQRMVDFAMQYIGLPYVWAGAGPGGFDCSGLTMYVAANVLGIDITHSTVMQFGYGSSVAYGDWAPGDLVFFANTYTAGISHVGIYIGDGQFVHAENSATGVVVSSLYDSYYAGHYAGARRIA